MRHAAVQAKHRREDGKRCGCRTCGSTHKNHALEQFGKQKDGRQKREDLGWIWKSVRCPVSRQSAWERACQVLSASVNIPSPEEDWGRALEEAKVPLPAESANKNTEGQ